jgi:hypothetical protein
MNAADAVLLADDLLAAIEHEFAATEDSDRRHELENEHNAIWVIRERAAALAEAEREKQAIAEGVHATLEATLFENRMKAHDRCLARVYQLKQERQEYGVAAVKQMGLSKWLKPR